ncbi:hypothetical protein MB46_01620 [Arthrobacter alpinus]|uniref:mandelate racemase/muconate lactonizing enzyme family protein n=1 Tax=Arthrobacter alpinus TaxID=656366 RepID=UPI0005CAB8D5|nr:dipeptide epimerase [Arthrobacter alpinus]ALV44411.1 hypothetical protein MB46_01620 [Arthrobacter alpinus]
MKLASITAHRISVPLLRAFTTAVRSAVELETVIVELRDDAGLSGWGEAPISVVTKTTTNAVIASVEGPLWSLLASADSVEHALERLEQSREPSVARAAVDCALHDLAAQQAGMSLPEFLGRQPAGTPIHVTTDMTLSVAAPEKLAATALQHVSEGFDCLKVKLNAAGDPLAAMVAVRAAVGKETILRVDANQAFTPEQAITFIRGLEKANVGVEFVEQPVAAADWAGLAKVSGAVGLPIMADESVWTCADLDLLLEHNAASMINIKLAKTGGIRHAKRLADRAADAGLVVVVGCMLESSVGIAAAAAFASTLPVMAQDLDGGLWLAASPVSGGAQYRGSEIWLSPAPGLGITGLS